jgi:hypothetical protein
VRARSRLLLLLSLASLATACSSAVRAPAPDLDVPRLLAPSVGEPAPEPEKEKEPAEPLTAVQAELVALGDPLHLQLFARSPQAPLPGFAFPTKPKIARFPGVPYATVRAYTFGFDGVELDHLVRGCGSSAIAADGTLCPSVVVRDDVVLEQMHIQALQRIVAKPPPTCTEARHRRCPPRVRMGCEHDARHAFVFFDAEGAPVAEIDLGLTCGAIIARPASAELAPSLDTNERAAARKLCSDLGLGGCFLGNWDGGGGKSKRLKLPVPDIARAGIALDKPVREASALDKQRLCAIYGAARSQSAWQEGRRMRSEGIECIDGVRGYSVDDMIDCVRRFPACEATIREVAACVSSYAAEACIEPDPAPAACAKLEACTWGMHRRTFPKTP